jgi:beta-lactam-binding protein with PASTA domain
VYGLIAASALTSLAKGPASQPADNPAAKKAQVAQHYGRIPLSFEANQGKADKTVKFLSNGSGYSLFLTDSSAVLALTKPEVSGAKPRQTAGRGVNLASARLAEKTDVVRMDLAGANRATHVAGMDQLPGTANYFIGNDPAQWHSGVPTFAKVKYASVYPGIDLVYYGNQRQLEYDFVVAPGASAKPIRLEFAGAKKLDLTADGDLTVSAANGEIAFHKPVVYQVKDGLRQPVEGQFAMLAKNTIGFALGRYDHSKQLVIDPVLSYSTYLGGGLADAAYGIVADSSGNAYVVGTTFSTNFPETTGAVQPANSEPANFQCVFVSKLDPTGSTLLYSTYLGGSGNPGNKAIYGDVGQAIAVDSSGDAYVTGEADSTNFPVTTGAFQTVSNSTKVYTQNAFVTKLNPTGTALLYSTYLGGNNQDYGSGIAVDSFGYAYVTGNTSSSTFPVTAGAFQVTNNSDLTAGWSDAFVTKVNLTGTALVYSTYLGGSLYGARGVGVAVDSLGDAYVTGSAASQDFPITNGAFQTTNFAAANAGLQTVAYNVFVTKLNPTGTALMYSTFLGGTIDDYGVGIALDGLGDAYVTGYTDSADFPVAGNPYQSTNKAYANEGASAFVTEVNAAGTGLVYSTFLSGTGIPPQPCGSGCTSSGSGDAGNAIAVDGLGDAYVTGDATSSDFPTTSGAYQTVNNAAGYPATKSFIGSNAFITKLNPGGSTLLYSTYLGGSSQDYGYGIALDGVGGVYVAGEATSTNFPTTTGSYQPAFAGGASDTFIATLAIGEVAQQVAVPSVVGDTQATAEANITGAGLVFTVTNASSSTVASGNVISESPGAGTSVNSGSSVNLVVSTGPAQIAVPNVVGDTQAAATTAITGAGLVVGTVTTASSSTVASGNVISESPTAGTSVNSGSAVNIVVSTGSAQVAVPNVVGEAQATAEANITGAGLVFTVTNASSSTVASGNVISESPSAGTSVNSGSSVNLVVSTGPAQVAVPNVVGEAQATAEANITGAGLVFTVTNASSSTVASGNVISESPTAGTSVNSGSSVNLVVSTGLAQIAVPNVVGDTQAAATTAITGAGLVLGTVTQASSSTVASGNVISESPSAGTNVNIGSSVNLVVSTGAAQIAVPNVVGDTQAAATTAITGAGLVVGTVTTASSSTVASGNVISESPSAGTNVNSGSAVNLVVSTGAAQVAVPNVVGDTQAAATTAITGAGLVVGTVTTVSSSTVASGNVISESPTAGTSVNSGSAVNLVVSTGSTQVNAPSYTLSANPSSLTIKSGSTGSTVITLAPTGGFTGTVNFACGTLPTLVTCSFAPTSLTVPSTAPLTTTLTIGTIGTATASLQNGPSGGLLPGILAALILLPLSFMRRILRTKRAGSPWLACLLLLAGTTLAAAGLFGMAGCGGSSKKSTPAGTYSIPITVTSGGTTVPLNLSITIQ